MKTMVKVVISTRGMFCVSRAAYERLGEPWNRWHESLAGLEDEERDSYPLLLGVYDPELRSHLALVAAVEELGGEAAGEEGHALKIVEVPDGVAWHIHEDEDGTEHVAENHRTWA